MRSTSRRMSNRDVIRAAVRSSTSTPSPGVAPFTMLTPRSMASPTGRRAPVTALPVARATLAPSKRSTTQRPKRASTMAWSSAPSPPGARTMAVRPSMTWSSTPKRAASADSGLSCDRVASASGGAAAVGRTTTSTETTRRSDAVSDVGGADRRDGGEAPRSSRQRRSSVPSTGLRAGSLETMRCTRRSSASGTSGRSSLTRGASSTRTFARTAMTCVPSKSRRPARHSKRTQPSAKTSTAGAISRRSRACSGAMYPGVPSTMPETVSGRVGTDTRAMPRSITCTSSRRPCGRNRLLGLRSRCTRLRSCRCARPSATLRASMSVSSIASGPARRRTWRSCPSSHGMTR